MVTAVQVFARCRLRGHAFAVAVADFVVGAVAFLSFLAVDAHAANTCLHQHFTGFAR